MEKRIGEQTQKEEEEVEIGRFFLQIRSFFNRQLLGWPGSVSMTRFGLFGTKAAPVPVVFGGYLCIKSTLLIKLSSLINKRFLLFLSYI